MNGAVFQLEHFAIHDGPGIRTVVFLRGCPLRCLWCHTPESQLPGECTAAAREIIGEVAGDKPFFDESGGGMTVSGGEPLFQPEFTLELLRLATGLGIHCCVETSGCGDYAHLKSWLPYTGIFLYDYKVSDPALHRELTGADNRIIRENLEKLNRDRAEIILRCPLIPGVNDHPGHLREIARTAEHLEQVREIHLIPYHPMAAGKHEPLPGEFPSPGTVQTWRQTIAAQTGKPMIIP